MWSGASGRKVVTAASSCGFTARRLCGATPTTASGKSARVTLGRLEQAREVIEAADESPLPGDGVPRLAETRVRVEHRQ